MLLDECKVLSFEAYCIMMTMDPPKWLKGGVPVIKAVRMELLK
jgi:hypothetical protein